MDINKRIAELIDKPIQEIAEIISKESGIQITYDQVRDRRRRIKSKMKVAATGAKEGTLGKDKVTTVEEEHIIDRLKREVGELKTKLKKAYRENNATEEILEIAKGSIQTIPYIRPHKRPEYKGKKELETAVSLLSCLHVGEVVSSDEMGGLGEYDFDVFLRRAQHYEDTVIDLMTEKMRGYEYRELVVLGLGDFVSGIIHEELEKTNEFNIVEQATKAAAVMSQILISFNRRLGIPVRFEGVVGNHGRTGKAYYYKEAYVNWDYVCYQYMQLMCAAYPQITFNIPKSFYHVTEVEKQKILFYHGNNIRGWSGIPWYGISRAAANFQAVLAGVGKYYDYMVLSHFHQTGMQDAPRGEYMMNGTWKGGDEYALGSLALTANPRQWLFSMHPKNGITWRFTVNLRAAKPYDGRYQVVAHGQLDEVLRRLK